MGVSVLNSLHEDVVNINDELEVVEDELGCARDNLKKVEAKLKQAKSSVYQATKLRNELKVKLKRARLKAGGYLSKVRRYGKNNIGKILTKVVEEDL